MKRNSRFSPLRPAASVERAEHAGPHSPVSVVAYSRSPFTLAGLETACLSNPRLRVTASSQDADSALRAVRAHQPRVVLWNLGPYNPEFMTGLLPTAPNQAIVAVLQAEHSSSLQPLLRAGVNGFLFETCNLPELPRILLAVADGEVSFSAHASLLVATEIQHARAGSPVVFRLTRAEQQVLALVVRGLSNKQAAQRLNVSPRTVESHRASAMAKLGAANAVELTRIAIRLGFAREEIA